MRDPDLVLRAQHAASALERAWERWRVMHGFGAEPLPPVSSYVGYSLEEPWGQPRVVFGIGAEEAEKLAAILDGHDCVGPVHAEVSGRPEWRQQAFQEWRQQPDSPAAGTGWPEPGVPLPVPAQQPQPESESVPNGQFSALTDEEPLAELPPFPEEPSFPEEPQFPAEPGFGDHAEQPKKFAAEFVAAPVPADVEVNGAPAAKAARTRQARTRQVSKPAGTSPAKAGQAGKPSAASQADAAADAGPAKPPVRRKPSLNTPLQMSKQMSKRVRPRRSAAPAAASAGENGVTAGEAEQVSPESTESDADQ